MKKFFCLVFTLLLCLMVAACGTQNNTSVSNEFEGKKENNTNISSSAKEKPEDIAEKAVRYVFEKEDVDKAMKLHHSSDYIQGMFSEMYADVLEDITRARHQAGGMTDYKPGYKFVSCKYVSSKTINSGEMFDSLNEAIIYYGGNSFNSMTESSFEVSYKVIDEMHTFDISVYVAEENGELRVLCMMSDW